MFERGPGAERSPLFLLAPSVGTALQGTPVERVPLLRDEGANLAWAVEAVTSPDGFDSEAPAVGNAEGAGPTSGDAWRYRLRTRVPASWFPLVPVDGAGGVHFELGSLTPLDETPAPAPSGRLLAELAGREIPEEEIPRSGTELVRAWQYTRWTDGRQHVWLGRRRRRAQQPGDSGLRFDSLERPSDDDVP